jgi:uridylate kinase
LVIEESAIVVIIFTVNNPIGIIHSIVQRYILSCKFHNNSILLFVGKYKLNTAMGAYNRVLLKLSGESLGGPAGKGIDENWLAAYAEEVAQAVRNGLQVAIVIGGGNIFRGLQGVGKGFDRVNGDKMGMLATVINSLGLAMAIRSAGVEAEVFTATPMMPVARYYMRDDAVAVMEKGGVALIAGGTGNPYFTTDSGAALRALEIGADALLKGTRVDGVYTADPEKDPTAVKYEELTFDKAIEDRLKVMDQTAFALCREGNMPIIVFDMNQKGNLTKLVKGEKVGTLVHV